MENLKELEAKKAKIEAGLNNSNIADSLKESMRTALKKIDQEIAALKPEKKEKIPAKISVKLDKEFKNLKKYISLYNKLIILEKKIKTASFKDTQNLNSQINFCKRNGYFYYNNFSQKEKEKYEEIFQVKYVKNEEESKLKYPFIEFKNDFLNLILKEYEIKKSIAEVAIEKLEEKLKQEFYEKEKDVNFAFSSLKTKLNEFFYGSEKFEIGDVVSFTDGNDVFTDEIVKDQTNEKEFKGKSFGYKLKNYPEILKPKQLSIVSKKEKTPAKKTKKRDYFDLKANIEKILSFLQKNNPNNAFDFIIESLEFSYCTLPFLLKNNNYSKWIVDAFCQIEKITLDDFSFKKENYKELIRSYYPDVEKGFISKESKDFLRLFVGKSQYEATVNNKELIPTMVKVFDKIFETSIIHGSSENEKFTLHYFNASSDVYIKELDYGTGLQDFGYTVLNGDHEMAEQGYVSIQELIKNNFELDYYFEPKTLQLIQETTWRSNEKEDDDYLRFDFDKAENPNDAGAYLMNELSKKYPTLNFEEISGNWFDFNIEKNGTTKYMHLLDNGGEFKVDLLNSKGDRLYTYEIYFSEYDNDYKKITKAALELIEFLVDAKNLFDFENENQKETKMFIQSIKANLNARNILTKLYKKEFNSELFFVTEQNGEEITSRIADKPGELFFQPNVKNFDGFGLEYKDFDYNAERVIEDFIQTFRKYFGLKPQAKKEVKDASISESEMDETVSYYVAQILNEFGVSETEIQNIDEEIEGNILEIEFKLKKGNVSETIIIQHVVKKPYVDFYYDKEDTRNKFVFHVSKENVESFLSKHLDEFDGRTKNEIYPFADFLREHAEKIVGEKVATKTIKKLPTEKIQKLKEEYKKVSSEKKKPKESSQKKGKIKLTKRLIMQGVTQEMVDEVNKTGEGVLIRKPKSKIQGVGSEHDKAIKGALKPGKRLSANGKIYYEYRTNMADVTKTGL